MFGLLMIMFGIALAIGAKEFYRGCGGSDKAVDTAKDKTVDFIDRMFK